jgi:Domain of unknown function (DUF1707)
VEAVDQKERVVVAPDQHLRASDAEREQVIDDLRQHAADGRLTMDEFEQRVAEALAARTRADLEPVLRELPALERAPRAEPRARRRVPMPSGRTVFAVLAIVFAVVMVTQDMWWIIFPLMGVLGGCGRTSGCSTSRVARHHARRTSPDDTDVPDERELIRV